MSAAMAGTFTAPIIGSPSENLIYFEKEMLRHVEQQI